jgi:hypothetical protein
MVEAIIIDPGAVPTFAVLGRAPRPALSGLFSSSSQLWSAPCFTGIRGSQRHGHCAPPPIFPTAPRVAI